MEVDAQEKLESRLPTSGEDEFEEKMIVGGVEITPESPLKELKQACRHLGIGVTGSKPLLWQRLKKEVAENKLKTMVDISKSIQKEFERDPNGPRPVNEPTPEERALHELTHLPKADWWRELYCYEEQRRQLLRRLRRNMMDHWSAWISSSREQEMKKTRKT